mgnify:CR=1 FL=1
MNFNDEELVNNMDSLSLVIKKTFLKDKDRIYSNFDSEIDAYNKKNRNKIVR